MSTVMKQKQLTTLQRRIVLFVFIIAGLAFIGCLTAYVSFHYYQSQTKVEEGVAIQKPAFSFNSSKATGWWTGGSMSGTDNISDARKNGAQNLPSASIAIAQGTSNAPGACFVMFFYQKGAIDADIVLETMKADATKGHEGLSLKEIGTKQPTVKTFEGEKNYILHQYNLVGAPGEGIARGVEFGYLPLGEGYIEVRGYCEAADQLIDTLPVFHAVELKS